MDTKQRGRTGPAVLRECGFCEGVGEPSCPVCKGTGRVVVDVKPFVRLESAVEALQTVTLELAKVAPPGHPGHWLNAYIAGIEDTLGQLFQDLVVLIPEEHERTEGD